MVLLADRGKGLNTMEILFSKETIAARVQELGACITKDYEGKAVVLLCILKGSFIFAADLARSITLPTRIEFLGLQSYGSDTKSSGVVQITQDLTTSISGEHVIIVEDIIDTGLTISYLLNTLKTRNPKSIKVCTLLHKPARTVKKVPINYLGFTIEDLFVLGYGLDYDQRYRNLPEIWIKTE